MASAREPSLKITNGTSAAATTSNTNTNTIRRAKANYQRVNSLMALRNDFVSLESLILMQRVAEDELFVLFSCQLGREPKQMHASQVVVVVVVWFLVRYVALARFAIGLSISPNKQPARHAQCMENEPRDLIQLGLSAIPINRSDTNWSWFGLRVRFSWNGSKKTSCQ